MTQQLRAGILSAPLAAIDRRALSQAWYSALGYARERTPAVLQCRAAITPSPLERAARACGGRAIAARTPGAAVRVVPLAAGAARDPIATAASSDRRAPASRLARAIERRFAQTPAPPARATFALDGGRVHVILRSRGGDVRLIALCAPAARVTVARALEEARYALAARGIALGVERIGTGRPQ